MLKNRDANLSADDDRKFQAWLDRDPENGAAYDAAVRLMGDARTAILSEPALRNFKVKPRPSLAKITTTAILALALAGGAFLVADGPMRLQADAMSSTAEMPVITLADGSTMHLNASSAVSYRFTGSTRTVVLLRGQAFFQVARDANRPFAVEARRGRTTALGTAFDVRIGDDTTDVTVTEHAVSVAPDDSAEPAVRLEEGLQATYGRDGRIRDVRKTDTSAVLAWRRGQLVVDNAPLAEVVAEIGRHFSGRIVIAGSGLADRRVSGTFAVTDTDAALALLQESLGLTVTRFGLLVFLRG